MFVTVDAEPVRMTLSEPLLPPQGTRTIEVRERFRGFPAVLTEADAVAPGTATPLLYSVAVTVPAAVGSAVTEMSTS